MHTLQAAPLLTQPRTKLLTRLLIHCLVFLLSVTETLSVKLFQQQPICSRGTRAELYREKSEFKRRSHAHNHKAEKNKLAEKKYQDEALLVKLKYL